MLAGKKKKNNVPPTVNIRLMQTFQPPVNIHFLSTLFCSAARGQCCWGSLHARLLCLCVLCLSLWQQVWPLASRWRSCERCLSGSPCSTSVTMASSKRSDTLPLWWASSTQIAILTFHFMYRVRCWNYLLVIYHLCSAAWSFALLSSIINGTNGGSVICQETFFTFHFS